MNRSHRSTGTRARRGVTLIELIVAMTILTIGLLAIVGVSASISRSLGDARNDNLAAVAAQSRFEALAGQSCSSFSLGTTVSSTTRGISESYTVADGGNNTRLLTDVVSWHSRRATRSQTFTSLIPCRTGA